MEVRYYGYWAKTIDDLRWWHISDNTTHRYESGQKVLLHLFYEKPTMVMGEGYYPSYEGGFIIQDQTATSQDGTQIKLDVLYKTIHNNLEKNSDDLAGTESENKPMGFCAYVGAKKISQHDWEQLQSTPNHEKPKVLNFTDKDLKNAPSLKQVVDDLHAKEFPPNDRVYALLTEDEIRETQNFLYEKSISKYHDPRETYVDPYYQDSKQLDSFKAPRIVVNGNLYNINGLGSMPITPKDNTINIEWEGTLKDNAHRFTEEKREENPSRRYVELSANELDAIPQIKEIIEQIGTWESSIRKANDVGSTIQKNVIDFMKEQSLKQLGEGNETSYFFYNGNYYKTEFVIC